MIEPSAAFTDRQLCDPYSSGVRSSDVFGDIPSLVAKRANIAYIPTITHQNTGEES